MPRLFAAIDLPENTRDDISEIYAAIRGARWTPKTQLHLTLRFIGDVNENVAQDIDSALRKVKFDPFGIQLKSTGFFPPRGQPKILWCGITADDGLLKLRNRIERILISETGLSPDPKKFHPHVTIARLDNSPPQKLAAFLSENALFQTESFTVSEFCLYSSILKRDGAFHVREAKYGAVDAPLP